MNMKNNCLICGAELLYTTSQEEMECSICGKKSMANARCKNGHFVCDSCHEKDGISEIKRICMTSDSKNPIAIITQIMASPLIHMHGPEHHLMVGAALLTAYKNCVASENQSKSSHFEKNLKELFSRGQSLPGGTCGFWGTCGAAMSCGIFFSLITRTTPLAKEYWSVIQKGTANSLNKITLYGGPRCCKRSSWLSILAAIEFTQQNFGVKMEGSEGDVICGFSSQNSECIGSDCPFYANNSQ